MRSGNSVHPEILMHGRAAPAGPGRPSCYIAGLHHPLGGGSGEPAARGGAPAPADRFDRETVEILKRVSRRPIEPRPGDDLIADLGFDSLEVLELVGELEDHFGVAVPLDQLTGVRTVAHVAARLRALAAPGGAHP